MGSLLMPAGPSQHTQKHVTLEKNGLLLPSGRVFVLKGWSRQAGLWRRRRKEASHGETFRGSEKSPREEVA